MESEIKKGDRVKMSEDLKKGMIENGSVDHIIEFGDCEGYVEDPVFEDSGSPEVDVRWEPSELKYGYDPADLVKVVDMNKPANVVLNDVILECEAQCGTPFYENILKAMGLFSEQEASRRERIAYRKGLREMSEHMTKEIKDVDSKIKNFEELVNNRIDHLKDVDAEFCKDRWDMTKPENERNIYREMSNQVTATRQELEMLKRTLSIPDELVITIIPADPDESDGKFCWEIYKGRECVGEARTEFNSKEEAEADAKEQMKGISEAFCDNPYRSVREIANETYKKDMAAFAEGCGKPFTALAWHIYKRAFDIASYSLNKKPEPSVPDIKGEFIICSAVNWQGKFICGRKHKDCYVIADALMTNGFLERERKRQGFMTSTGRYVGREEAFKIAKANHQIVHKLFDGVEEGNLNSEDLFGED